MLTKVTWGFASIYGAVLTALTAILAAIALIGDQAAILGIPPRTLLWIAAALVIVTTLGRFAQLKWGERPVGVGWRTWVTFIVNTIAALMLVLGDLVDDAATLGVSQRAWAIMTAALAIAIILGRQLTAAFGDGTNTSG